MNLQLVRCQTTIYKRPNGAALDVTDYLAIQPEIEDVESYGATSSFSVVNDTRSPQRNLLNGSCSRWDDGSVGAIETGMYVSFRNVIIERQTIDGAAQEIIVSDTPISYQMIMSITPSSDTISFTCGDAIQILRANGVDYFYDHYAKSGLIIGEYVRGGWDNSLNKLYIIKPSKANLMGGSAGDAKWLVTSSGKYTTANTTGEKNASIGSGVIRIYFRTSLEYIQTVTIDIYSKNGGEYISAQLDSKKTTEQYLQQGWNTYSFGLGLRVDPSIEHTLRFMGNRTVVGQSVITFRTGVKTGSYDIITRQMLVNYDGISESGSEVNTIDSIAMNITAGNYVNASGSVQTSDTARWYIDSIVGVTTITSSMASPNIDDRAVISYVLQTDEKIPMNNVFDNIVLASGMTPNFVVVSTTVGINVFRCSGAMYHDYLLALADLKEISGGYIGKRHCISAGPDDWGIINMGLRHNDDDIPKKILYYAGDPVPEGSTEKQLMMLFNPNITKSRRPNMSMVKATTSKSDGGDGDTIMVAIRDPEIDIGSSKMTADTSSADSVSAAFTAYNDILTNRSNKWEGIITLSGIHTEYLDDGNFLGSGVPIRIFDSRFGMEDYASRVRGVKYNYKDLTTTLTINNYSIEYGNEIINTEKMAFTAGSISISATSAQVLNTQYVRVETTIDKAPLVTNNNITVTIDGISRTVPADMIDIDDLGVVILYARIGTDPTPTNVSPHSVTNVKVNNGTSLEIPVERRPDKYYYQSLIINVQIHR